MLFFIDNLERKCKICINWVFVGVRKDRENRRLGICLICLVEGI